jgi:low temperature requirement protein LtrA
MKYYWTTIGVLLLAAGNVLLYYASGGILQVIAVAVLLVVAVWCLYFNRKTRIASEEIERINQQYRLKQ